MHMHRQGRENSTFNTVREYDPTIVQEFDVALVTKGVGLSALIQVVGRYGRCEYSYMHLNMAQTTYVTR